MAIMGDGEPASVADLRTGRWRAVGRDVIGQGSRHVAGWCDMGGLLGVRPPTGPNDG